MPTIKKILQVLTVAVVATGCMSVPRTTISFDPKTKQVAIESPKDITLDGLKIRYAPSSDTTQAQFEVTVDSYTAKNNVEMLREVVKQNQETALGGAKLLGTLLDMAK